MQRAAEIHLLKFSSRHFSSWNLGHRSDRSSRNFISKMSEKVKFTPPEMDMDRVRKLNPQELMMKLGSGSRLFTVPVKYAVGRFEVLANNWNPERPGQTFFVDEKFQTVLPFLIKIINGEDVEVKKSKAELLKTLLIVLDKPWMDDWRFTVRSW